VIPGEELYQAYYRQHSRHVIGFGPHWLLVSLPSKCQKTSEKRSRRIRCPTAEVTANRRASAAALNTRRTAITLLLVLIHSLAAVIQGSRLVVKVHTRAHASESDSSTAAILSSHLPPILPHQGTGASPTRATALQAALFALFLSRAGNLINIQGLGAVAWWRTPGLTSPTRPTACYRLQSRLAHCPRCFVWLLVIIQGLGGIAW
jgi:hypothetical protein